MKKINVKKLNAYLMSQNNACEMRSFVQDAVNSFLNDESPRPQTIQFLNDLGLLLD